MTLVASVLLLEMFFTSSVSAMARSGHTMNLVPDNSADLYPPLKKVKSDVWSYYGFATKDQQDEKPICRVCRKKVAAPKANTSNLHAHLRDNHPALFAKLANGKGAKTAQLQTTMKETFNKKTTSPPTSKMAIELNEALAYFIVKDMLPFQAVEKPGFLQFVKKAVPQYQVPTRQFFSRTEIPRMYSNVKAEVCERLAQASWFAATTDLWTSSGGGEPYISFSIHFVSAEWELQSYCLETLLFPQDHTPDHIQEMIENILQEWGVSTDKFVCITTDNASNMQKAFEHFPDVWLGCFGHNLNLAVSKILNLERVESAVRACRHLVQGFSRSWKRRRELRAKQTALQIPVKSLIHDVVTQWGSTFKMLERFLSQQQAITATLAGERGAWHLMPKETDISVMEQVCELLGPLSQFTDALAVETRMTLSTLKHVLQHIKTEILIQSNDDPPLITQMKKTMREDLDSRYSEKALKMMDIACFIDPRFKGNFSENLPDVVSITVQEALRLVPVNVRQEPPAEKTSTPISTSTLDKASQTQGLTELLKIAATRQQRSEEQSMLEEQVKAEVKIYMCLPSAEAEEDPLLWWGGRVGELPHLSNIARRFLCIPATSVPSERIFSASGSIVTPHRARLNPDKVNMLTFLHFNLP